MSASGECCEIGYCANYIVNAKYEECTILRLTLCVLIRDKYFKNMVSLVAEQRWPSSGEPQRSSMTP